MRVEGDGMRTAVIYARFPLGEQTEDSTKAQIRKCREYATAHGLFVIGVYAKDEYFIQLADY